MAGNQEARNPFFPVSESLTSAVGLLTLLTTSLAVSVSFNQSSPSYNPSPFTALAP